MSSNYSFKTLSFDLTAGLVVFLVALPLCLGVALSSNAPLFSGILSGIIGGILVGFISGSQTSVSGPTPSLTIFIATEISRLGSFDAFLTAIMIAGLIQIILGISRLGFIAAFFPSSVIKGLLWAIGINLVLKQIPHIVGHDADPLGDESFFQPNNQNTLTELLATLTDIHPAATLVGILSIILLIMWDKIPWLKQSYLPSPLVIIVFGVLANFFLRQQGVDWTIKSAQLVQVPVPTNIQEFFSFLTFPDFSILKNSAVYTTGITLAALASLETLLNIEAVDKLDPKQRSSPPNRELLAQGIGNVLGGLIGALPTTSVIIRSSVNLNAGAKTKLSTILHGILLLTSVILIPSLLNQIPLAALAAILLITGLKLASPQMMIQMWKEGKNQFLPFIITVVAIVFSNLLVGVLIGLATSICFILHSHIRRPLKKIMEKHATGDEVLHIELPNQVGFFYRPSLESTLRSVPTGGHILLDANNTDYIDPDVLDLITDFQKTTAKAHQVQMSLTGFKDKYPQLEDRIHYIDFSSREVQAAVTPERVLQILKEGNERFRQGIRLTRDLGRQLTVTSSGQFPMAVILSCIDSRSPAELIFDLSLGDIFSVRIAGNIVSPMVLGSMEYSCAVAGAKLILVMGHTSCGAVRASVDLICKQQTAAEATGCTNLDSLISDIQQSVNTRECKNLSQWPSQEQENYVNDVARKNVLRTISNIRKNSPTLDKLAREGKIAIVGGMYDISTAEVSFFQASENGSLIPINPEN